jgi:hypothetical protein
LGNQTRKCDAAITLDGYARVRSCSSLAAPDDDAVLRQDLTRLAAAIPRFGGQCQQARMVWGMEDDAPFDAMISLNMVHITPWEAALGLLAGAGRLLRPDGILFLYGPFMLGGTHTAASNAAFDADLKRRDPRWGVRDVDDLVSEAAPHGLELREVVQMPVNNLSLVFVKAGPPVPV